MAVNLVFAVTDGDWFEMLRQHPNLGEVNFWAPSAANFRALRPGELFLFKLHAPRNVIVGGGVFTYANALPCSLAWEAFGVANGARSALRSVCTFPAKEHVDWGGCCHRIQKYPVDRRMPVRRRNNPSRDIPDVTGARRSP